MSDLISRQAALYLLVEVEEIHPYRSYSEYTEGWTDAIITMGNRIALTPAAEPERKKGKWIVHDYALGRERYECAECKGRCDLEYNFCPNCGADMRGSK